MYRRDCGIPLVEKKTTARREESPSGTVYIAIIRNAATVASKRTSPNAEEETQVHVELGSIRREPNTGGVARNTRLVQRLEQPVGPGAASHRSP